MKKVQDFIKYDSALIEAPSTLLLRSDNLICSFQIFVGQQGS
jgi:hypothetical protein